MSGPSGAGGGYPPSAGRSSMQKLGPPQSAVFAEDTLRRLDSAQMSLGEGAGRLVSACSLAATAESLGVRSVFIVPDSRASVSALSASFWAPRDTWTLRGLHVAR